MPAAVSRTPPPPARCAGRHDLRGVGFQLVAVAQEQFQSELRVGGIRLGVTRRERLAVFRQRGRMNREEHQKIVLLQSVDERSLGELQAYRHRLAAKALSQ